MLIQLNAVLRLLAISSLVLLTACSRSNDVVYPQEFKEVAETKCADIVVDERPLADWLNDQLLTNISLRSGSSDSSASGISLTPPFSVSSLSYSSEVNVYTNTVQVFASRELAGSSPFIESLRVTLTAGSGSTAINESIPYNTWSSEVYLTEGETKLVVSVDAELNLGNVYIDCVPSEQQLADIAAVGRTYKVSVNRDGAGLQSYVGEIQLREGATKLPFVLGESALDASDALGTSVAIYGDTLVVGVPGDDNGDSTYFGATSVNDSNREEILDSLNEDNTLTDSGAAYVFERSADSAWVLVNILKADYPDAGDRFGHSVSVYGDFIAVSALYEDSASIGVNGSENNNLAPDSGAVYLYRQQGSAWAKDAYIKPSRVISGNSGFYNGFGRSVLLDEQTLFVSSPDRDLSGQGADAGAVDVYEADDDGWSFASTVSSPYAREGDRFGRSISVSGNYLLVGAPGDDSNFKKVLNSDRLFEISEVVEDDSFFTTSDSGAAHLFKKVAPSWVQVGYFKASNSDVGDAFGSAVDFGRYIAIGAPGEDGSSAVFNKNMGSNDLANSGAVYHYIFNSGSNKAALVDYIKSNAPQQGASFGSKIRSDGGLSIISSVNELVADEASKGQVYVLENAPSGVSIKKVWGIVDENTSLTELAGAAIDISNGIIAIGAPGFANNILEPATPIPGTPMPEPPLLLGAGIVLTVE
jgi:hypothetical protein